MATTTGRSDTNFTVFIRLPFPRGDFVDPPPVSAPVIPKASVVHHVLIPSGGMECGEGAGAMGHSL
jgi:hypothetical protein